MEKSELVEKLSFLFDENKAKQMVMFSYAQDSGIRRLNIEADLTPILLQDFIDSINDTLVEAEYEIQDYSVADRRPKSYYRYDLEKEPESFSLFNDVLGKDIPVFDFTRDKIRDIKKILVVISTGEERIILFKDVFEIDKFLIRDHFMMVPCKDRFSKISTDILKVNTNFQIIKVSNEVFSLSLEFFEKYFKLEKVLRAEASKGIERVVGLIKDTSHLSRFCEEDTSIRNKLIATKSSFVFETDDTGERKVSNADLIDYINKNPDICGKFDIEGNQIKIESKAAAKRFLKVLNEDCLKSGLTNTVYEIISKRKRTGKDDDVKKDISPRSSGE